MQPMELRGTGGEGGTDSGVKQTVFFDDVRVPAFALVGGENQGLTVASDAPRARARRRRAHRPQPRVGSAPALLPGDQARRRAAEPAADVRDSLADIYIKTEIPAALRTPQLLSHVRAQAEVLRGPQLSY